VRPGEPTVLDDVNRAFCTRIGAEAGSLRSSPLSDVVAQIDDAIDSLVRRGSPTSVPAVCTVADGHATRMLVHMSPLGDEDGSCLVLLQITEETVARETERALRESEKRVQDLVDNVNTLIYIKATDGSYILVNRHFEEMFGISRFDAPLCTNIDFFPPHIAEIYSANDAKVLQTGVPMEFEEPRADGGAWLTLKFPLFDVDGDIYAVGGISTDISLRRREELLARRAKDEAERANEAKSQFLSRMSHELRTPLNSILGFGQLLQLQVPPGPRRESVDRIVMAGRHLLALINEVLEISRIEAHASQHEVEPVDVCRPLTDAVELLRPLAQERGIDIVQDLHGGLYRCVLADPQRLTQVLLNVLSNAIKYNRIGGSVRISFRDVPARGCDSASRTPGTASPRSRWRRCSCRSSVSGRTAPRPRGRGSG
jgi:PAS domain S-box-containing protein